MSSRRKKKIAKYLDIPIQHCSEKVLRAMNRTGGRETLKAQLRHIRERVPESCCAPLS